MKNKRRELNKEEEELEKGIRWKRKGRGNVKRKGEERKEEKKEMERKGAGKKKEKEGRIMQYGMLKCTRNDCTIKPA